MNNKEEETIIDLLHSENIDDVKLAVIIALKTQSNEFLEQYFLHKYHRAPTSERYCIYYKNNYILIGYSVLGLSDELFESHNLVHINLNEE